MNEEPEKRELIPLTLMEVKMLAEFYLNAARKELSRVGIPSTRGANAAQCLKDALRVLDGSGETAQSACAKNVRRAIEILENKVGK